MSKSRIQIGSPMLMRETNARTLLRLLKELGPCSRADLVRETGMSAPTVGNVISDLDGRGLIEWTGEGTSSGGRRPDNLRFKADAGYVAGVDITSDALRVLLTDLNGTLLEERSCPLARAARAPAAVVETLYATVRAMLQQHHIAWDRLLAMTTGVAGITDVREGVVISVGDSSAWRGIALRALLQERFSCSLSIENDANLAATGERFCGVARAQESFISILLSSRSGVGAGIFVNGQIVHGSSWTAGEIGYLHVPNISSAKPALYQYGSLEQILSGPGIVKAWKAAKGRFPAGVKERNAVAVLDLARSGNPVARRVLQHRARVLSDVVLNLSLMLNPGLFVLGGDLGSHPAMAEPVVELLSQSEIASATVLRSSLGDSAIGWGAVSAALQQAEATLYARERE